MSVDVIDVVSPETMVSLSELRNLWYVLNNWRDPNLQELVPTHEDGYQGNRPL